MVEYMEQPQPPAPTCPVGLCFSLEDGAILKEMHERLEDWPKLNSRNPTIT